MDDGLPEKDKMLFGTLAYRMISKAAEIIPADQVRWEKASPLNSTTHKFAGSDSVPRESNIDSGRNRIACSNSKHHWPVRRDSENIARRFFELGISNWQARPTACAVLAAGVFGSVTAMG